MEHFRKLDEQVQSALKDPKKLNPTSRAVRKKKATVLLTVGCRFSAGKRYGIIQVNPLPERSWRIFTISSQEERQTNAISASFHRSEFIWSMASGLASTGDVRRGMSLRIGELIKTKGSCFSAGAICSTRVDLFFSVLQLEGFTSLTAASVTRAVVAISNEIFRSIIRDGEEFDGLKFIIP